MLFQSRTMVKAFGGVSLSEDDLRLIDDAISVVQKLYGLGKISRAQLVRTAIKDFTETKRAELKAKERKKEV